MPNLLPRLALLLLPFAPLWTGCAQIPVSIPDGLLNCRGEPPVPAVTTDADLGGYIVDLADAGRDCRAKLSAVRGVVK